MSYPPVAFVLVAAAAVAYLSLCALTFYKQRSFIYFPQPESGAASFDLDVAGTTIKVSSHVFETDKALIFFGGNASSVGYTLPALRQAFPERALYLMNYRGYAGSEGSPSEEALHADAAALYRHVKAKHEDIVVIGISLGSGVAVRLASEKAISRLVLVTPFDSMTEVARHHKPYLPVSLLLKDKFESFRYASKVMAATTIILAGKDQVVPVSSGEKLAKRFGEGLVTVVRFPDDEHHTVVNNKMFLPALQGAIVSGM